jgi:hypothetical protein
MASGIKTSGNSVTGLIQLLLHLNREMDALIVLSLLTPTWYAYYKLFLKLVRSLG